MVFTKENSASALDKKRAKKKKNREISSRFRRPTERLNILTGFDKFYDSEPPRKKRRKSRKYEKSYSLLLEAFKPSRTYDDDIKAILTAMTVNESDDGVQDLACSALCNVASNDVNAAKVVNEGGIKVVLDAMKKHRNVTQPKH